MSVSAWVCTYVSGRVCVCVYVGISVCKDVLNFEMKFKEMKLLKSERAEHKGKVENCTAIAAGNR